MLEDTCRRMEVGEVYQSMLCNLLKEVKGLPRENFLVQGMRGCFCDTYMSPRIDGMG